MTTAYDSRSEMYAANLHFSQALLRLELSYDFQHLTERIEHVLHAIFTA